MQKVPHRECLIAGIILTCGIVITGGVITSTPPAIAQKIPGEMLTTQSVIDEDNNLKLESHGCRRTKPLEVMCDVLITNAGNTRQLLRFRNQGFGVPPTNAIDSSGTVYSTTLIRLGTYVATPYNYVEPDLTPGIPTKISFIFEMPREVTQLAALDLSYEPIAPNASNGPLKRIAIPNIGTITSKSEAIPKRK